QSQGAAQRPSSFGRDGIVQHVDQLTSTANHKGALVDKVDTQRPEFVAGRHIIGLALVGHFHIFGNDRRQYFSPIVSLDRRYNQQRWARQRGVTGVVIFNRDRDRKGVLGGVRFLLFLISILPSGVLFRLLIFPFDNYLLSDNLLRSSAHAIEQIQ